MLHTCCLALPAVNTKAASHSCSCALASALQFVIFFVCAVLMELRGTFNLVADYKENYFLDDKLWCKLQHCVPVQQQYACFPVVTCLLHEAAQQMPAQHQWPCRCCADPLNPLWELMELAILCFPLLFARTAQAWPKSEPQERSKANNAQNNSNQIAGKNEPSNGTVKVSAPGSKGSSLV